MLYLDIPTSITFIEFSPNEHVVTFDVAPYVIFPHGRLKIRLNLNPGCMDGAPVGIWLERKRLDMGGDIARNLAIRIYEPCPIHFFIGVIDGVRTIPSRWCSWYILYVRFIPDTPAPIVTTFSFGSDVRAGTLFKGTQLILTAFRIVYADRTFRHLVPLLIPRTENSIWWVTNGSQSAFHLRSYLRYLVLRKVSFETGERDHVFPQMIWNSNDIDLVHDQISKEE